MTTRRRASVADVADDVSSERGSDGSLIPKAEWPYAARSVEVSSLRSVHRRRTSQRAAPSSTRSRYSPCASPYASATASAPTTTTRTPPSGDASADPLSRARHTHSSERSTFRSPRNCSRFVASARKGESRRRSSSSKSCSFGTVTVTSGAGTVPRRTISLAPRRRSMIHAASATLNCSTASGAPAGRLRWERRSESSANNFSAVSTAPTPASSSSSRRRWKRRASGVVDIRERGRR